MVSCFRDQDKHILGEKYELNKKSPNIDMNVSEQCLCVQILLMSCIIYIYIYIYIYYTTLTILVHTEIARRHSYHVR